MVARFIFIHSPLVGPYTWQLIAQALGRRGIPVTIPTLTSPVGISGPYWQRHAAEAARAVPDDRLVILVAHSGAGSLLPAVRQALGRPVAGYLFVDAGLPKDGQSHLEHFGDPEAVAAFREAAKDGLIPPWTENDLREVIPDAAVRRRFASELRPLPLAVYEEKFPVFAGWPDAPCAYLQFGDNPAYTGDVQQARQSGWPHLRLEGEHFHMLVDPQATADALVALASRMGLDLSKP